MAAARKLSISAVEAVCVHIVNGMGIKRALEQEGWKSVQAFLRFVAGNERAAELYRLARETRAELWAEELIEIADDGSNDTYTIEKDGREVEVVNHDHIRRSQLRVDTRKWVISKHLPKTYGDKVQLTGDGGGPVEHVVKGMTDEDLDARIRQLLPQAGIDPAS